MQSHLSWRSRSSPSTGLFALTHSRISGLFALSLYTQPSLPVLYGRVDVDALDLACVAGEQGLERVEVVAVDDQVVVGVGPDSARAAGR